MYAGTLLRSCKVSVVKSCPLNEGFICGEKESMGLYKRNKLIAGVGINDADYNVCRHEIVNGKRKTVWTCPFYKTWANMLTRCYSEAIHKERATYAGCSTCDDWHLFSNFKAWMEQQDWQGKHLDKDLLLVGNRVYGPETCLFLDPKVNTFLTERGNDRGEWPLGVYLDNSSGKYKAVCYSVTTGKQKSLGRFNDPEKAHEVWLAFKLEQAYILAGQQTDERVSKALIDRYENYGNLPKAA